MWYWSLYPFTDTHVCVHTHRHPHPHTVNITIPSNLHYDQDESRPIYQYHFTSWKDKGRPSFGAVTLLHFHQKVHSKDDEKTGPLVVHCRYV